MSWIKSGEQLFIVFLNLINHSIVIFLIHSSTLLAVTIMQMVACFFSNPRQVYFDAFENTQAGFLLGQRNTSCAKVRLTKPGTGKFTLIHVDYPEHPQDITYFHSYRCEEQNRWGATLHV